MLDGGVLEGDVDSDAGEAGTPVQGGSDEEFVPSAAPGPLKRAKLAESLAVATSTMAKTASPTSVADHGGDETDGCSICYEPWTSGGLHRVCSLRCGHLFGKQCIETWLTAGQRNKCPQCNAYANRSQIRVLFVKNLQAIDTSERDALCQQLEEEKASRGRLQEERAAMQLSYNLAMTEINQLRERIRCLEEQSAAPAGQFSLEHIRFRRAVNFAAPRIVGTGEFSARCVALDDHVKMLVVGGGRSATETGVHKVSLLDSGRLEYYSLHGHILKALACSPHFDGSILTTSFDRTLKLSSLYSHSTLLSYVLPAPGWSCSFDPSDRNSLYAGLASGLVCKFDVRQTRGPLWQRSLQPRPVDSSTRPTPLPIHSVIPLSGDRLVLGDLTGPTLGSMASEEYLEVVRDWSLPGCCSVAATEAGYFTASSRSAPPLHLVGSLQPDERWQQPIQGSCPQSSLFRSVIVSDGARGQIIALPDGPNAILYHGTLDVDRSLPSLGQTSLPTNSLNPILDVAAGQISGKTLIALLSNHQLNIFSS